MSISKAQARKKIVKIFEEKIFKLMADSGLYEININLQCECGDITTINVYHQSISPPDDYPKQVHNVH